MKKFFIILSACLLLACYLLIPEEAPSSRVWEWLACEAGALTVLYILFHSFENTKSNI